MSDPLDSLPDRCRQLDQLAANRDWPALLVAARQAGADFPEAWEPAYHEGRAMLESGAYEHANHFLLLCMDRFPSLPQFAVLYGYVGARSLNQDDCAARWQQLHGRLPDAPGVRIGLAQAWRATGRPAQAEQILAEGLQRLPDHLPMLVQYADSAALRRDWNTAADRWDAVRARAPERMDVLIASVSALRQANRLDEAEALARQGLAAEPGNPELNTSYAAIAAARQDFPTVALCLQRVLAASPDNASAAVGLVAALLRLDRGDEAEAAAEAALAHHPDHEVLLTEYAAIASRAARWPAAVARWKQVYQRCPARITTYQQYIDALVHNDDLADAEEIASEAVGFAPDDRALLMAHAHIASLRLDTQESQQRWGKLKRRFPDDPEIAEAALKARKLQFREVTQKKLDDGAIMRQPVRGSIRRIEKPQGAPRTTLTGPSALDIIMSGAALPQAAPAPAPPTGVSGFMKRLFGKA